MTIHSALPHPRTPSSGLSHVRGFDDQPLSNACLHELLAQAVQRLKPGGRALVCIPNVQHWSVMGQLILGHWPQQDAGLFDRTHIRWFTLRDMHTLLQGSGLVVEKVIPRIFQPEQGLPLLQAMEAAARVMRVDPQQFRQLSLPLQYVLVGRKPLN